jgi:hypothetical protein
MKAMKRNCGIAAAALLMALALAGCLNPIAPPAAKAAAASAAAEAEAAFEAARREPYTAAVYLGGEDADARSIAGPTKERISLTGIRNYVQLIAVDKADRTIAGNYEERGSGAGASATLMLKGLASGHTYGILLLQGHWERDYAKETVGNYVYTAGPPVLLSAGYTEVTFSGGGSAAIGVWPIYVDTAFTAGAGGLGAEPAVNAGKPKLVSLPVGDWAANWKILRGASGTASGLGDLVRAQKAAGFPGENFIVTGREAVVWTAMDKFDTLYSLTLTGHTVTLPLAGYAGLPQAGSVAAANFALSFAPCNLPSGWAAHDAASVFDLRSGPPRWVIRNGLNALPQDDRTDFTNFGNVPVGTANGNGAVRFTVANPQNAAAGELVVSDGQFTGSAVVFTASGYTGTAQLWYAAVPSGGNVPAYDAYFPLGNVGPGTVIKPLPLSGTAYDIYLVLLKDGKAGAAHLIGVGPEPEPPPPVLLTSAAAVRNYLASLDARIGSSAAKPIPLLVKMYLAGADSIENLLAAIGGAGKYVDLDLSQCSMSGTAFDPRGAGAGKNLVVSLVLPGAARSIPNGSSGNRAFKDFRSLKTAGGSAVTSIGERAFYDCRALTTVNFPAATTIVGYAFQNCTALTTVNLPVAATIGEGAFSDCTALTTLNLPAATTIVGMGAFGYCTALTTLNLPAATAIGQFPFTSTGTTPLTVTLGRNAPKIDEGGTSTLSYAKTVTISRPANNTGYDAAWQAAFKKCFGPRSSITLVFQNL